MFHSLNNYQETMPKTILLNRPVRIDGYLMQNLYTNDYLPLHCLYFFSYKLIVCLSLIMNHFDKILFFFMPSNVESDKTVHTDASEKLVCSNL